MFGFLVPGAIGYLIYIILKSEKKTKQSRATSRAKGGGTTSGSLDPLLFFLYHDVTADMGSDSLDDDDANGCDTFLDDKNTHDECDWYIDRDDDR